MFEFLTRSESSSEEENLGSNTEAINESVLLLEDIRRQGIHNVADAFFELHEDLGKIYGWNSKEVDEDELLKILTKAGITREEINTVVNFALNLLDEEGLKKSIDFGKHPELKKIKLKLGRAVKALGSELTAARA